MKKNLTNAELIAILSKRPQNALADIFVDYSTIYGESVYSDINEDSGVCYSDEDDQLVIFSGEFEC